MLWSLNYYTVHIVYSMYGWSLARNQGKSMEIVYVAISKAFDKVCHNKHIAKVRYLLTLLFSFTD